MLKNALISLLGTKPIEKISVYELCDRAEINRTTFYKYYGSQYELLNDIENDLFSELEELFRENDANDADELTKVLTYLAEEREICRVLINTVPDKVFSEKLFSLPSIRELLSNSTPDKFTPVQREYIHLFFYQGGYAIIRRWLNRDCRESPSEIASLVSTLGSRLLAFKTGQTGIINK